MTNWIPFKKFLYPRYANNFLLKLAYTHITEKRLNSKLYLGFLFLQSLIFIILIGTTYYFNQTNYSSIYFNFSYFDILGINFFVNLIGSFIGIGVGLYRTKTIFAISCIPFSFFTYFFIHILFSLTRWFFFIVRYGIEQSIYGLLLTIIKYKELK